MQIRVLKTVLAFFLLLVCTSLQAQQEVLVAIQNESVSFSFLSQFTPSIGQSPQHGDIEMVEDPTFNYTLTYTPDEDYLGLDEFTLVSHPFGFNVRLENYLVEVKKADIRAHHDQASTQSGTPVSIPVLNNDYVNLGGLQLTAVPVVNGGSAEIAGSEVRFTPDTDFVGLADLNYVVCSDNNTCTIGTATINVSPASASVVNDTVRVFTKRNNAQLIFAEPGAVAVAPAQNGHMIDSLGVMAYLPAQDFIGAETLVYSNPTTGGNTVFEINVLDIESNTFAFEDRAFTPVDAAITFNVLHNDLYSVFADCVEFGAPRYGSLVPTGTEGELEYQPPAGWSGVDRFSYSSKPPGCTGEAELATVYVFVSDFAPAEGTSTLELTAGTSVPITYQVPNGIAVWTVETQPSYGSIATDTETGALIYTAATNAVGNEDSFTVNYCLNPENGACSSTFSIPVNVRIVGGDAPDCDAEDCVWPGDTNRDGVVDVSDLLPIANAMGKAGTPRLSASPTNWNGQYAEDWGASSNGVDLKHVDANGDQVISAEDTLVVIANMGKAYRLHAEAQTFTTFELSLIGPATAEPGDLIQLDIIAGNETVIVEDIYGFRFPINYDPGAVVPSNTQVNFPQDRWIAYGSPIISVSENDTIDGEINAAFSRTNLIPISGWGKIGTLNTVIVEDIYGFFDDPLTTEDAEQGRSRVIELGGGTGVASSVAGHQNAIQVNPFSLTIVENRNDLTTATAEEANAFLNEHLLAFPNPVAEVLTVHLNGQQLFTGLQLTDLTGRVVLRQTGLNTNHRVINVADLPTGLFTLTVTTPEGVVNRMIQVN